MTGTDEPDREILCATKEFMRKAGFVPNMYHAGVITTVAFLTDVSGCFQAEWSLNYSLTRDGTDCIITGRRKLHVIATKKPRTPDEDEHLWLFSTSQIYDVFPRDDIYERLVRGLETERRIGAYLDQKGVRYVVTDDPMALGAWRIPIGTEPVS